MSASRGAHETVLLSQAVDALVTSPDGTYVDATFGRGGHSALILERLGADGRLIAIDKDPDAIVYAQERFGKDDRFAIHHGSFADLESGFDLLGERSVDGVLADLGVSSPQLDNADRGFSFMQDGPLDMRMNTSAGESAAQWLARVSQTDLANVLWEYGEERFSRRIAAAIVEARSLAPIVSTGQLASIILEANPSWEKHKHPATRSFQAIRIHINSEIEDLKALLRGGASRLCVGGRLVVISFHSLEDRLVKRFMRDLSKGTEPPRGVPVRDADIVRGFKVLSKALKPGRDEVEQNVRARSAIMRSLEKTADV